LPPPHHQFQPQGYPGPGGFRPPMGQAQKPMNQTGRLERQFGPSNCCI
jgi:hypothetical protein